MWFASRQNPAVQDSVRQLDARMAVSLHAATTGAGFIEEGPHFGAGMIVRLFDRMFEHVFAIARSREQQDAIVLDVIDMISGYMERYATPAGLDGVPAEEFVRVFRAAAPSRKSSGAS